MDLNDRLRNHLQHQHDDLRIEREGPGAVRSRSRRRRQRRAGAMAMGVLAFAAAGVFALQQGNNDVAQVATDGDTEAVEAPDADTTVAADDATTTVPAVAAPGEAESALPDPGTPLQLIAIDTANAPGGYNASTGGAFGDLYYVLSTAPGSTWEDTVDVLRSDTVYAYDGTTWTSTAPPTDRFVSNFDVGDSGLVYVVSTGSATSRALEVGQSADGGETWAWTEVDLAAIFGPDPAAWPQYTVQSAQRGTETLLIVRTLSTIDNATAADLAAGAGLDLSVNDISYADATGIGWMEAVEPVETTGPDCAADYEAAFYGALADFPEPSFEWTETPTDAEAEALITWSIERQDAENVARRDAAVAIAGVPGCETFSECAVGFANAIGEGRATLIREIAQTDAFFEVGELPPELMAKIDALDAEVGAWITESGCADTLARPLNNEGYGEYVDPEILSELYAIEEGGNYQWKSWAELGVDVPTELLPRTHALLVNDGIVTDLGEPFGQPTGFLAETALVGERWNVVIEAPRLSSVDETVTYTRWTSADGAAWDTIDNAVFRWGAAATPDGTMISVDHSQEMTALVRSGAAGAARLDLADLAGDLDTTGFSLVGVSGGEYGVVAWAVNWEQLTEEGGTYESIVLYSPDGVSWGATEVPDAEVVSVIVGETDAMIFLNDPDRPEGEPQPILLGAA